MDRRISAEQVQLYWSILIAAGAALLYLGYDNKTAAMIVEAINFFAWNLAQIPLFALAARATPKGSEALGYSIIMSAMNWALSASDLIGSRLFDMAAAHMTIAEAFKRLVWINAGTTALVLIAVPMLPKVLRSSGDGHAMAGPSAGNQDGGSSEPLPCTAEGNAACAAHVN